MLEVALTFDDGPNPPYTDQVLDILDKYGVSATFFVVGVNVQKYPKTLKQIYKSGHTIGNHSFSHYLIPTSCGNIFDETIKTQKLIEKIIGPIPKLFRSPFGISPPWLLKKLSNAGFSISPTNQATWGHDYLPWMTTEKIVNRIIGRVSDSSIILLHDGVSNRGGDTSKTVQALPLIIEGLLNKGYQFKNLSELITARKYRQLIYP